MTRTQPLFPRRSPEAGTALIITLFFLVLITIIAVGFMEAARMERSAAGSHRERMRATNLAREGIESLIATLRRETVDPARNPGETDADYDARKRNWISQPGQLIVPDDLPADPKLLKKAVPLSTGAPSAAFLKRADLPAVLAPPNLNIQTLVDQNPATYLITDRRDSAGAPAVMQLRWMYVRADGTRDLDGTGQPVEIPDLANKTNPIVGRYAYWTDDESAKINYNLAWKRDTASTAAANSNTSRNAHPSRVNLMGLTLADKSPLTEPMADAIHNWVTKSPGRYFNSFADARQVSPDISRMLDYNKFELTHYNHDPDTTFFGEDRILLTMDKTIVPKNSDGTYARKFLDILRDDMSNPDPGILENIAGGQPDWRADVSGKTILPNKLDAVVRMLMRYISEKNWPLSPGVSFKDKYYPGTPDSDARLGQIAVNILDYVRAKESTEPYIAPMRFAVGGDGKFTVEPTVAYGAANSYQGICRAPYITEMGMWMEKDPAVPSPLPAAWPLDSNKQPIKLYKCTYKSEIFLPARYELKNGIDFVPDLSPVPSTTSKGWYILWTENHETAATTCKYYTVNPAGKLIQTNGHATDSVRIMQADISGGEGPNKTVLNSGKRIVVTKIYYRDRSYAERNTLSIRSAILYGTSGSDGLLASPLNRWPRVNIGTQTGNISYKFSDPATTTLANMVSIEVDDPRCNVHVSDWVRNAAGTNTFGLINSVSTIGKAPTKSPVGSPQQDTDDKGLVTDYSLYMPPPKGVGSNDATHDNGRVTSIAELGYVHTGNNAKTGSTPWRTIRLQPNKYPDAKTLPDWAFMDLFTVPNTGATVAQPIFTPHGTSVGGRISVNSHVAPFDTLVRDRGLVALLTGTAAVPTAAAAEVIAANIYNRTLATGPTTSFGKVYGYPWTPTPKPTDPNAFDTPGEICEIKGVADGGEKSEELVREIASLITSRGSVFSVYTVGQSLKQTPAGKLIVTAEQRQHAIVERYVENRGTPEAEDDEVRFRTVYFRNLTP